MDSSEVQIQQLLELVQSSEKYRHISPDLISALGRVELQKRPSLKEAAKATRNKLHQIGSAYQEKPIRYAKWLTELDPLARQLQDPSSQAFLKRNLAVHASTKERLPILENFFQETLASISPIHSILDLACGLNPLALPWMPTADGVTYHAYDIYQDMTDYLRHFFLHYGIRGDAHICDLTQTIPQEQAQIAFVLKTIPCLEQLDKNAGKHLLENLQTENILVSFPVQSLGGRSKGMVQNYESHFLDLIREKKWKITRFLYSSELAFLIQK